MFYSSIYVIFGNATPVEQHKLMGSFFSPSIPPFLSLLLLISPLSSYLSLPLFPYPHAYHLPSLPSLTISRHSSLARLPPLSPLFLYLYYPLFLFFHILLYIPLSLSIALLLSLLILISRIISHRVPRKFADAPAHAKTCAHVHFISNWVSSFHM